MLTIVQHITSRWSRAYRGGPRARIRNQVPEAALLEFPTEWPGNHPLIIHELDYSFFQMGHDQGNEARHARLRGDSLGEPFGLGSVWIRNGDGKLTVDYHWTAADGAPERHTRKGVLELQPGEWGRVRYNARMSRDWDQREWHYEKHVFNFGLFPIVDPEVFLNTDPVKIHSEMAQLW